MVTTGQRKTYEELRKQKKLIYKKVDRKTKLINFTFMAIGAVIGIFVDVFAFTADIQGILDIDLFMRNFLIALLLLIFVMYPLHIILHEAGHLVFGLLTGYRFLSFRIFSITFIKKDGRIHLKKYSIKGTAGQCLMYPPEKKEDGSFPYILYNLGGGISNLIFSIPVLIPAALTDNGFVRALCLTWAFMGIILALTNLIPMTFGVQNDGKNLKSIHKDPNMREVFYLQLKINSEMSDGKQIQEYSPDIFKLPEGIDDTDMLTMYSRMMEYYQQLAFNNFNSAKALLAKMEEKLDKYQPTILNMVELERLFFMVLERRPIEEIAVVYERVRIILGNKTDVSTQRIRYIYEACLSEEEKFDIMTLIKKKPPKKWKACNLDKLYQDFLKTAKNSPVSGEADLFLTVVQHVQESPIFIDKNK
ncbi:MAG: hypothetical protein GX359_11095 [Clostridiales bacterium]|nr:hypothetical protein [Clostridiales bacterium]